MFKVKYKDNGFIQKVYAVESSNDGQTIWFLLFIGNTWEWKNSNLFVPVED